MTTKEKAKEKAPRADGRKSDGRFAAGNAGGPGRPPLPDRLKRVGPKLMDSLIDDALGKNGLSKELEQRAKIAALSWLYNKPGKGRMAGELPTTKEERIKLAEDLVLQAAAAGDTEAARAYLAANAPEKWGRLIAPPDDPKMNDSLRFVPLLDDEPDKEDEKPVS